MRTYQVEGVHWLERLSRMYLNGILADDMGLGKTVQAIVAITQYQELKRGISLIVCPTSLVYNWKEEFSKFNPGLKVSLSMAIPINAKKMIEQMQQYDIIITSYTLTAKRY